MKKIIVLILLFLAMLTLPLVAAAEKPLVNGTVKELDGQGRLKAILKYRDSLLVRKRVYDEKGQLLLDTVYRDEKAVAIKTYYLNGQLKSAWSQKSEEARFFYPTGQPKITIPVKNPARLEQ